MCTTVTIATAEPPAYTVERVSAAMDCGCTLTYNSNIVYGCRLLSEVEHAIGCRLVGTVKGTKISARDCVDASEPRGTKPAEEVSPSPAQSSLPRKE